MISTKKNSFTFIELLVVIGIFSLILPITFTLYFLIFYQQAKILALQEVKKQGDFALNSIRFTIQQYAEKIYQDQNCTQEVCNDSNSSSNLGQSICLKDRQQAIFRFYLDNSKIASLSSRLSQPFYLTNSNVVITDLNFSCQRKSIFSSPIVSISFKVTKPSSFTQESASLNYQTKIKLRTYSY